MKNNIAACSQRGIGRVKPSSDDSQAKTTAELLSQLSSPHQTPPPSLSFSLPSRCDKHRASAGGQKLRHSAGSQDVKVYSRRDKRWRQVKFMVRSKALLNTWAITVIAQWRLHAKPIKSTTHGVQGSAVHEQMPHRLVILYPHVWIP